jgi:hypothetical protein
VTRSAVAALDHLVYAVPDLDAGARRIEELLGVATEPGGRHPGRGSRNRLIGLGPDRYLEIVGPDPEQPAPGAPRWFGLDVLRAARLATWCAKAIELGSVVERGRAAGLDLGEPTVATRLRADGTELSWTFTDPLADRAAGVVPFLIDWGDSEHPGRTLAPSCSVVDVRLVHPEPEKVGRWLTALGLDVVVRRGDVPRVVATLKTPNGVVELP